MTTVARCDQLPYHGPIHTTVISWYLIVPKPENWQPGDAVKDAHQRVFYRTISGYWFRPGLTASFDDDYPTRPLVKLVPEQTP